MDGRLCGLFYDWSYTGIGESKVLVNCRIDPGNN